MPESIIPNQLSNRVKNAQNEPLKMVELKNRISLPRNETADVNKMSNPVVCAVVRLTLTQFVVMVGELEVHPSRVYSEVWVSTCDDVTEGGTLDVPPRASFSPRSRP